MTPEKEALSDKFELLFEVGLGTTQEDLHEYIKNKANQCASIALGEVLKGKIDLLDDLNDFDMYEVFGKIWRLRDELEAQLKQLETPNL